MSRLITPFAVAGIGAFCETKFAPAFQATGPAGLNPLCMATPLVLIGVGFFSLKLGFEVGQARSKYKELARKDGEKDVDERYSLPNLYVSGTSKHAKAFNAKQRAHQHILETYPAVVMYSVAGALQFPICTAVSTVVYAVGRVIFSNNYAQSEGDVAQRYSANRLARHMWTGLLVNLFLGAFACIQILASTRLVVVEQE